MTEWLADLRLELLSGAQSAALRGALYGLLMLLPQSDAFHALRNRLQCAPAPSGGEGSPAGPAAAAPVDFAELLLEFQRVQREHRAFRLVDRSRAKLLDKPFA